MLVLSGTPARAQGTITPRCTSGGSTGTCSASKWYTSPVSLVWEANEPPLPTSPCKFGVLYKFDTDSVTRLACKAEWSSESNTFEFILHVEASSPTAEGIPSRAPDSNGWYNHPVAVTFGGHGYSGPAACMASGPSATAMYAGPDAPSATVSATCTDPAGKSVQPSFALRYDATLPAITGAVPSRPPDFNGWYNHPVSFLFTGTDATSGLESCT